MPVQQQPMTPMPFYADPNRFPTPVWQTDPSQGWQGQFIQQLPATAQPIETYQQYPNGIYQTTYQQPTFETNTFYTGAVQVLTNTRPPSVPNQQVQLAPPRPSSNYSHTPSPSPAQQSQQQQTSNGRQYQEYISQTQNSQQQQQNFIASANTQSGPDNQNGSNSRPNSVNAIGNPPTPNQNFNQQQQSQQQQAQQQQAQQQAQQQQQQQIQQQQQQQQQMSATAFTTIANFSPNPTVNYVNANSGNAQPGYPQVNHSSPQLASHNSSGYPGQEQYGGQQWQNEEQLMWEQSQVKMEPGYEQDHQNNQYGMQQEMNNSSNKMDGNEIQQSKTFSQSDKVNLNTRIKTMILNKQQENKVAEESKPVEQNSTGHFLWYSHHQHLRKNLGADGGSPYQHDLESNKTRMNTSRICDASHQLPIVDKRTINPNIENDTRLAQQINLEYKSSMCHGDNESKYSLTVPLDYNGSSPLTHNPSPKYTQTIDYKQNQIVPEHHQENDHNGSHTPLSHIPQLKKTDEFPNQMSPRRYSTQPSGYPQDVGVDYHQNSISNLDPQRFKSETYIRPSSRSSIRSCDINDTGAPISESNADRFLKPPSRNGYFPNVQSPSDYASSQKTWVDNGMLLTRPVTPHTPNILETKSNKIYTESPGVHSNAILSPRRTASHSPKPRDSFSRPVTPQSPLSNCHSKTQSSLESCNPKENKPNQSSKLKTHNIGQGVEIPDCECFSPESAPSEPGAYYTHLGCANNLKSLRHDLESRTGVKGTALRIEKVRYSGKEGKTAQGCPIAKWIIRRQNVDEKYLVIVKHRRGHICQSAYIVVCLVAWEGVDNKNADELYLLLKDKLNKFGVPTKRRCATNEPRTCACQGICEDNCGASFSFGCSWSMYYNGCKFTRSKDVRKFRLNIKSEETYVENKLQQLADHLSPIYKCVAPKSFRNQTMFENIAGECRLGIKPGRPFSGVTACVDFCAHAHKDLHNMIDGCTVVVTLTKHRGLSKPAEEQLHVLPLYVAEETDEFDSKENQATKIRSGCIEVLERYPCEVRTCSVPAEPCLRRAKKSQDQPSRKRNKSVTQLPPSPSSPSFTHFVDDKISNSEIQNEQVSSTVLGYPKKCNWRYDNHSSPSNSNSSWSSNSYPSSPTPGLPQLSLLKPPHSTFVNFGSPSYSNDYCNQNYYFPPPYVSPTPLRSTFPVQSRYHPLYQANNPFDDCYSSKTLPTLKLIDSPVKNTKTKHIDISFTDNVECFKDGEIGGVAIALSHGSVLFECAKHELHATTALKNPDRLSPTRISLVFYQHRSMNKAQHGFDEYTDKMRRKQDAVKVSPPEKSDTVSNKLDHSNSDAGTCKGDYILRTPTLPTMSLPTMFPMYPCIITGPFLEQMP